MTGGANSPGRDPKVGGHGRSNHAAALYLVSTPIGNLGDLSPRALEVLGSVDIVAAEDTRVARRLLSGLGAGARRIVSYREDNERRQAAVLIRHLLAGRSVALVSDSGSPCVSDPGYRLVKAAAGDGIEVRAVPGPSALTAMVALCGLPSDRFCFEGFLPTAAGPRRRRIAAMAGSAMTHVVYESPRRVVALLRDLAEQLGDPETAVGRELTKVHEEVLRGRAAEVAHRLEAQGARGEFVVALFSPAVDRSLSKDTLEQEVGRMLAAGMRARDVAASLKERGVGRRRVYETVRELKRRRY